MGYERRKISCRLAVPNPIVVASIPPPARLALNEWALAGEWTMGKQEPSSAPPTDGLHTAFMRATFMSSWVRHGKGAPCVSGCRLTGSRRVLRTASTSTRAGTGTVVEQRLYQLVRQPKPIVDRRFEIEFLDAGVETLAFTFG